MYYLNARYYAPAVGRFISRDSFQGFEDDPASLNQYSYAKANPVMYVDPDGHIAWWIVKGILDAGTGAFAGVVGYLLQLAITGQKFSWWSLAYNAGIGAVSSVVSGFFHIPGGKVNQMLFGAGKSLVSYVAQNYKHIGTSKDFLSGAVISILSGAVCELIKYKSAKRYVDVKNMLRNIL